MVHHALLMCLKKQWGYKTAPFILVNLVNQAAWMVTKCLDKDVFPTHHTPCRRSDTDHVNRGHTGNSATITSICPHACKAYGNKPQGIAATYREACTLPYREGIGDNEDIVEVNKDGRCKAAVPPKNKTPEEELTQLSKEWSVLIYAFYKPDVSIKVNKHGKRMHLFWLDKKDKNLTSNLCKHVKKCFGKEALASADTLGIMDMEQGLKEVFRL
ncbi:uncharacterized protein C8Q71DRAFT_721936 [Rhodofomes roseus]|uniref:Uncharacterized protein n=1 Tax=Rhodofomes roseus TaxID=34475 RepID=A0ABQ8KP85_9APHY|nr:uncharacterized protein C8Q71DRAFT_721936 [Rhodofomes roseus]KAH9840225.1 hypothetical protein C8Q71DRAFT_721936 [Rhodofomes roseus]